VLEPVLDRLGGRLAARRLDRGLKLLEGLRLEPDEPIEGVGGLRFPVERGDLGRRPPAERDDLLGDPLRVVELGMCECQQLVGIRLILQADRARRHQRVLERRSVLRPERCVQRLDLGLHVHSLLGHPASLPLAEAGQSVQATSRQPAATRPPDLRHMIHCRA
jgi:hypothetical protein